MSLLDFGTFSEQLADDFNKLLSLELNNLQQRLLEHHEIILAAAELAFNRHLQDEKSEVQKLVSGPEWQSTIKAEAAEQECHGDAGDASAFSLNFDEHECGLLGIHETKEEALSHKQQRGSNDENKTGIEIDSFLVKEVRLSGDYAENEAPGPETCGRTSEKSDVAERKERFSSQYMVANASLMPNAKIGSGSSSVSRVLRETARSLRSIKRLTVTSKDSADDSLNKVMTGQEDSRLQRIAESTPFRLTVMILIWMQSVVLGWQQHWHLSLEIERLETTGSNSKNTRFFNVCNNVLNGWFLVEWLFRVAAYGKSFFTFNRSDPEWFAWNMFDTSLLVAMVLFYFDLHFTWIRSFRLFRIARVLRIFKTARKLRKMTYALLHSIESIFWLILLLLVCLYIFSLVFMQGALAILENLSASEYQSMLSKDDGDIWIVVNKFGSLELTMTSLFAAFTGGYQWDDLLSPIMGVSMIYKVFGLLFVITFVFAFMNVVTGVFVEDAMKIASVDQSLMIANVINANEEFAQDIERLMTTIDKDHDDSVNREELTRALQKQSVQHWLAARDIGLNIENLDMILNFFDKENSSIKVNELAKMLQMVQGAPSKNDILELVNVIMGPGRCNGIFASQ